jgi:hypothetical protein
MGLIFVKRKHPVILLIKPQRFTPDKVVSGIRLFQEWNSHQAATVT